MKHRTLTLFTITSILFLLFFGNCTTTSPLQSGIFTMTEQHVGNRTTGSGLTDASIVKKGEACSWSALYLNYVWWGPGESVEDAKKDGNITKVAVIDRSSLNVLGYLFFRDCVVVWGE